MTNIRSRLFILATVSSLALQAPSPVSAGDKFSVELDWSKVNGATSYLLQIATDEKFHHVVEEKHQTSTRFTWVPETAGFYYWRVASIDVDGDASSFSEFKTIQLLASNDPEAGEARYDTFRQFDEYSSHQSRLTLAYGPVLQSYYFSGNQTSISDGVKLQATTALNGQLIYEHWLSTHYSAIAKLRTNKFTIQPSDYDNRPGQEALNQYETSIALGIERKISRKMSHLLSGGLNC